MKFYCAVIILLAATAAPASADEVDELMRRFISDAHIPGAAVAVVRDGRIEKQACYGLANREWELRVGPDTRFQIASATKLFTAVLLMRMVDEGNLRLDDPVTHFIENAPQSWQPITIRHLAEHTSGLAPQSVDTSIVKTADALPILFRAKLEWEPGQHAQYGSWDFTILQHVLERAGGKPFAELLRDKLLNPLGLESVCFDHATIQDPQRFADDVPRRAEYYRWNGNRNLRCWYLYPQYTYSAGGAFASIEDMAKLIQIVDSGEFISPTATATMWQAPTLSDGTKGSYGIGWVVGTYRRRRCVGHSGGPALCDLVYFPDERLGIVVVTNQKKLYPQLAHLIANLYIPPPESYRSQGIPDDSPRLTSLARELIVQIANGNVDVSLLSAARRGEMATGFNEVGPVWLGMLDPIASFSLLESSQTSDGKRTRRHRILFGQHAQTFTFLFDKEDKISEVSATGD
jgi:CubicO group peptidase (beta-lactamase class C family)